MTIVDSTIVAVIQVVITDVGPIITMNHKFGIARTNCCNIAIALTNYYYENYFLHQC